jgi:Putative MetA-pathway of phenol degradation
MARVSRHLRASIQHACWQCEPPPEVGIGIELPGDCFPGLIDYIASSHKKRRNTMKRNSHRTLATAVASMLGFGAGAAGAADLKNFLTDLYGGDGIRLSAATPAPFAASHVAHFTAESLLEFGDLNQAIVSSAGTFAFNSSLTGVTFDVATGVPVETRDSLGPLLAERATTLGAGKINLAFSASRIEYDKLDGTDLDNIVLDFPHDDCCTAPGGPPPDGILSGFERDVVEVNIKSKLNYDVFALFANYGINDRWDVGIVVPVLSVEARAQAHAEVINNSGTGVHSFFTQRELQDSTTGGEETGLGDVIVRTKYNFVRDQGGTPDMAVLLQITTPTGDEKKLLGSGETRYKAGFVASKQYGAYGPHFNIAYEAATGPDYLDNLTYSAGCDFRLSNKFTAGVDVLGRYNPDQEQVGNNVVDAALSAKWNPWRGVNAPLNAYVILPLNEDEGLRSDAIFGIGIDWVL